MCVKHGLMKRFWSVVLIHPFYPIPKVIKTSVSYPTAHELAFMVKKSEEQKMKLPIYAHFDDHPQVYVLPVDIPYEELRIR
jgi:hypothetical protein